MISPLRASSRGSRLHDLVPDRRHLRPVVGRNDGRHDVAAEGRTGLVQVAGLGVDIEHRAVGGEAGIELRGDLGNERTADRGRAGEDDLGLVERCERGQDGAVGIVVKILERRVVGNVDDIGAVGDQVLCLLLDAVADEDG